MESAKRERVKVDSGSLIYVDRNVYSVSNRLIANRYLQATQQNWSSFRGLRCLATDRSTLGLRSIRPHLHPGVFQIQ
jgi:hypothetical protein